MADILPTHVTLPTHVQLVPMLSGALIKKKAENDAVAGVARGGGGVGMEPDRQNEAATKVQKVYRGRIVGKRIFRHVVSLATPIGIFIPADTLEKMWPL